MDKPTLAQEMVRELITETMPQLEAFKVFNRWLRLEHKLDLLNTGEGRWAVCDRETRKVAHHANLSLAVEDALERVKAKQSCAAT